MTLSTGEITIQRTVNFALFTFIRWIAVYPVDSIIHPLNNRTQDDCSFELTEVIKHGGEIRVNKRFNPHETKMMSRNILHITQQFGHLHLWINLLSTAEKRGRLDGRSPSKNVRIR